MRISDWSSDVCSSDLSERSRRALVRMFLEGQRNSLADYLFHDGRQRLRTEIGDGLPPTGAGLCGCRLCPEDGKPQFEMREDMRHPAARLPCGLKGPVFCRMSAIQPGVTAGRRQFEHPGEPPAAVQPTHTQDAKRLA